MAPRKRRLGKGAKASVTFSRLHPGDLRAQKYPDQRQGDLIVGFTVTGVGRKPIRRKEEDVVLLADEDGSVFWAKAGSVKVVEEGPEADLFDGLAPPPQPAPFALFNTNTFPSKFIFG